MTVDKLAETVRLSLRDILGITATSAALVSAVIWTGVSISTDIARLELKVNHMSAEMADVRNKLYYLSRKQTDLESDKINQ